MKYLAIIILFLFSKLSAQTIILDVENDVFSDSDYDYTHGTMITYIGNPIFPKSLFDSLMNEEVHFVEHSIFQFIYTPKKIDKKELQPEDRPWAGWSGYQYVANYRKNRRNIRMGFQLGVVGPYSFAQQSQETVHEIIDSTAPLGWDNQVGHHLAINGILGYQYKFLDNRYYDLSGSLYSLFGTSHVITGSNIMGRIGYNVPDSFGSSPSEPVSRNFEEHFSFYLLGGLDGRFVPYNATLDDIEGYDINTKDFVGDMSLGFGMRYRDFKITYQHVWRTREFERERKIKPFGVVSFSYSF